MTGSNSPEINPFELNEQVAHYGDLNSGATHSTSQQQYNVPEQPQSSAVNDEPPNSPAGQHETENGNNNFDFLFVPNTDAPSAETPNENLPSISYQNEHANPIEHKHDELTASPQQMNIDQSDTIVGVFTPQEPIDSSSPPQSENFDVRFGGVDTALPIHQVSDGVDVMMETTTRRRIEGLPTQDEDDADANEPDLIDDRINANTLKSLVGK